MAGSRHHHQNGSRLHQHGVFPNPVIILETQLGRAMLFKSPPDLCIIQLALFNLNQPIHPI